MPVGRRLYYGQVLTAAAGDAVAGDGDEDDALPVGGYTPWRSCRC